MTDEAKPNARPCGTCLHLDGRAAETQGARGLHYCWFHLWWRHPDEVVVDCSAATRATGAEPPGRLNFDGKRKPHE